MKRKCISLSLAGMLALMSTGVSATEYSIQPMVINGEQATITSVPWQAKLSAIWKNDFGSKISTLCGGSIISDSVVVSAAHCFEIDEPGYKLDYVKVYYNSTDSTSTLTRIFLQPEDVKAHESYSDDIVEGNDIAVLTDPLSRFSSARKIKVASASEYEDMWNEFANNYVRGQNNQPNLLLSGYGRDENGSLGNLGKLMVVGVPEYAEEYWVQPYYSRLRETIYVKSYDIDYNMSSCFGDSGGPLVWQNPMHASDPDFGLRLVGVAAFGTTDEDDNCYMNDDGFAGYTSIDYYKDWLNTNVELMTGEAFDTENVQVDYRFIVNPFYEVNIEVDNGTVKVEGGSSSGGSFGILSIFGLGFAGLLRARQKS